MKVKEVRKMILEVLAITLVTVGMIYVYIFAVVQESERIESGGITCQEEL
jgi:hypothetical protein